MSQGFYKEIPGMSDVRSVSSFTHREGLEKVAADIRTHIPPSLASKIIEIEKNPKPGMAYLYDRALGAGETYGPNNNGDWFGRQELIEHHDSFVKHAFLFRHHQNKDPKNSIGGVYASAYNYEVDAVDLIIEAPIEKLAGDIARFNDGELIQTSMGAKVAYDECSFCGNKASNRGMYCGHLKFNMLKVMHDGRQVYAKNPKPKFVDISVVIIAADPASTVLRKIASQNKLSEMRKNDVGGNIEHRPVVRPEVISATNHYPRADVMHSLYQVHGVLRPDEFQAVLRKDASLIRPDIIPYVGMEQVIQRELAGSANNDLIRVLEQVPPRPIEKHASYMQATFLTPEEKTMYLQYRQACGLNKRAFLR